MPKTVPNKKQKIENPPYHALFDTLLQQLRTYPEQIQSKSDSYKWDRQHFINIMRNSKDPELAFFSHLEQKFIHPLLWAQNHFDKTLFEECKILNLHQAITAQNTSQVMINILTGCDLNESLTDVTHGYSRPLHRAIQDNYQAAITLLLQSDVDIDAVDSFHEEKTTQFININLNVIFDAMMQRDENEPMTLGLNSNNIRTKIEIVKSMGRTALHVAAYQEDELCAQRLINRGADLEAKDEDNWTPLFFAHEKCTQILIAAGANKEHKESERERSALFYAGPETAKCLLTSNANVNVIDKLGKTSLHAFFEKELESTELLETLLSFKPNLNIQDLDGKTPLHYACNFEVNEECSKSAALLLTAGADTGTVDRWGRLALHYAAFAGDTLTIIKLLELNPNQIASLDNDGKTPLSYATVNAQLDAIEALIDGGAKANTVDNSRNSPLHYLMENSNITEIIPALELLFHAENPLDEPNDDGDTPIVLAFQNGRPAIVEWFNDHGIQLPEHLRAEDEADQFNGPQSVHTISVHNSISKSAAALLKYYEKEDLKQALAQMMQWSESLNSSDLKQKSAQNALARLIKTHFTDSRSKVTLIQALALVWLAINDLKLLPLNCDIHDELTQKRATLIKILYEIQRGYNLNAKNQDNNQAADAIICISGSFNDVIAAALGHPVVNIRVITEGTINAKMMAIVREKLSETLASMVPLTKADCGLAFTSELAMPEVLINKLKLVVGQALKSEFDDCKSEILNYDQVIHNALAQLEYMNKPSAPKPSLLIAPAYHLQASKAKNAENENVTHPSRVLKQNFRI